MKLETTILGAFCALTAGCQMSAIVGTNDGGPDAAAVADAPSVTVDTPSAGSDGGVVGSDVPSGADVVSTGDSGAGSVRDIEISLVQYALTSGPNLEATVQLLASSRAPSTTTLATMGSCSAVTQHFTETPGINAGASVVTVSIAGGAEQPVPYSTTIGAYDLRLGRVAAGTSARVRVTLPGVPVIERTLTVLAASVTNPAPSVFSGSFWKFTFNSGNDLTVGWAAPTVTDGQMRVLAMNPTHVEQRVLCTASPSSGSVVMPWSLLSAYAGLPGSMTAIPQLVVDQVVQPAPTDESGIHVATYSIGDQGGGLWPGL